jgi:hypothetical protein
VERISKGDLHPAFVRRTSHPVLSTGHMRASGRSFTMCAFQQRCPAGLEVISRHEN